VRHDRAGQGKEASPYGDQLTVAGMAHAPACARIGFGRERARVMNQDRHRLQALRQLARLHGVQTSYVDMAKRRQEASADSLLAVLRALGVSVARAADVPEALSVARLARARRAVEPVSVAWQGRKAVVSLQLPARAAGGSVACEWRMEDGSTRRTRTRLRELRVAASANVQGERFLTFHLPVPPSLPAGYHRLAIECANQCFETLLLRAPERCFAPPGARRTWGVFTPLSALHSDHSWGAGDFGDLTDFLSWVGERGGHYVGTLPLLPTFLDRPCEPSPYSPVSRLFWNELYLDLARVPELERCPEARRLMQSIAWQSRRRGVQVDSVVDYRQAMALKREVLAALSRCFFAKPAARRRAFARFVRAHPHADAYARFRAVGERRREPWRRWPERLRAGDLRDGDCRDTDRQYHLYVQWLAHEQMTQLTEHARAHQVGLYLDLPLGTHRDGYDCWRYQDLFALSASAGSPPDPVFTQGQNWGFAPIHPQRSREQGHAYIIAYLRHHLRHATLLRLDHVMGLHRLYWVPAGLPASRGAYVTYPAEEHYAILGIESHRHRAVIVGENLGTVPPEVERSLDRHGVAGMFVGQYEFQPAPRPALRAVPARSVASLNTHDMPPFHAYWTGLDLEDRRSLGLIKPRDMPSRQGLRTRIRQNLTKLLRRRGQLGEKATDTGEVLRGAFAHLAASAARWLLLNLEDLWLETLPQNVPGTSTERINWRRKTRFAREQLERDPAILDQLRLVRRLRRGPARR
jgi:4-alpha-glucanotransferase